MIVIFIFKDHGIGKTLINSKFYYLELLKQNKKIAITGLSQSNS